MPPRCIQFGAFELDSAAGELRKHGIKIRLQEQPLQILQQLLEHAGEIVIREDLQKRIWPADTFVDFDHGLYSAVQRLRDALGDNAETPRYVETLPRRGYRFIAAVHHGNGVEAKADTASVEAPASVVLERAAPRRGLRIPMLTATGVILVVILFALAFMGGSLRERLLGKPAVPLIRSLAVLPLQNLSSDPNQEYFADGMTDALITDLAQIGSLKVISRTSTMHYKKSDKTLPEIAQELNVDGIVEGTVQRYGDRVRITAQLIHGPSDKHLWAKSYERDVHDLLALETDTANAIMQEIRLQLSPQEKDRLSVRRLVNLKGLEAYLQGQYRREQGGVLLAVNGREADYSRALHDSIEFYQEALREDPTYAPAYVAMAEVWAWEEPAMSAPLSQSSEGVKKAKAALEKALALNPQLAEAHMNLGQIAFRIDWNWPAAEQELKRAIELNPNLASAHEQYAEYLDAMGRMDEGMKEFEILQQLDPRNQQIPDAFYHRRQFDRVIELRKVNVETHAYGSSAHYDLAFPLVRVQSYKEAVDEWIETMVELGYKDLADDLRRGYKRAGFKGAIADWAAGLENYKDSPSVPTALPAYLYTILGNKDRAFAWLERAYVGRAPEMASLNVDPDWDDLRSDPRFKDLVRRVGLPQ
jgi:TolB-like protein/DNA-binding winged helix-turn-helix (wHTH) protein